MTADTSDSKTATIPPLCPTCGEPEGVTSEWACSSPAHLSPVRTGECPVCLDVVLLRLNGTLRRHPNVRNCPGSGRLPKVHVHRCRCGATWDEHASDSGRNAPHGTGA